MSEVSSIAPAPATNGHAVGAGSTLDRASAHPYRDWVLTI
jgi:hypothetical protein